MKHTPRSDNINNPKAAVAVVIDFILFYFELALKTKMTFFWPPATPLLDAFHLPNAEQQQSPPPMTSPFWSCAVSSLGSFLWTFFESQDDIFTPLTPLFSSIVIASPNDKTQPSCRLRELSFGGGQFHCSCSGVLGGGVVSFFLPVQSSSIPSYFNFYQTFHIWCNLSPPLHCFLVYFLIIFSLSSSSPSSSPPYPFSSPPYPFSSPPSPLLPIDPNPTTRYFPSRITITKRK